MYKILERNPDPEIAMEIGIFKALGIWLRKTPPSTSGYSVKRDEVKKVININVIGNVVLEDFDIVNADGIKGVYTIEFGVVTGIITRLYKLTPQELYSRIRNYYNGVLDNCLGKTIEEQEVFLYGEAKRVIKTQSGKTVISLGENNIKDSEEYIRSLSYDPSPEQINDLVKSIKSGDLEYAYHAKDEFSVEMHQYAEAWEKILLNSPK